MPRIDPAQLDMAYRHFEKTKIFTVDQIVTRSKCSLPSARLTLKRWNACTSYNRNGRYYALPHIPKFDANGIWRFNGVFFSKNGNLKQTVLRLIADSPKGLTGKRLGEILGLSPRSFLHHYRSCPGIRREKRDGAHVYFSEEPDVYRKQSRQRAESEKFAARDEISNKDAVTILAAVIGRYDITAEDILKLPEMKRAKFTSRAVRRFMEEHGLCKKKIPDTAL